MDSLTELAIAVTGREPNRLAVLAIEINALDAGIRRNSERIVIDAFEIGIRLLKAKAILKHGEWLPWLKDNVTVTTQWAQAYMRIATAGVRNPQRFAFDSIRGALEALCVGGRPIRGTFGTGDNEWHTPPEYIQAARAVMGGIDLDPASHPVAQGTIQAGRFFTHEDDGLTKEWHGRVFLNPPYGTELIGLFVDKLVDDYQAGRVTEAILLTHSYTDTGWWHVAWESAALACFTEGRIKFTDLDGEPCAPTQGQAFFYFGRDGARFCDVFGSFGALAIKPQG
jgi:hypothetical protein